MEPLLSLGLLALSTSTPFNRNRLPIGNCPKADTPSLASLEVEEWRLHAYNLIVGWRGHDAYEADERELWRSLPLRQRYTRTGILIFAAILTLAAWFVWASVAQAQSLTDAQIATKIIEASRNAYFATGQASGC